jgi:hypothetical protein
MLSELYWCEKKKRVYTERFTSRLKSVNGIALAPIGQTIVTTEVAAAARKANAETTVATLRNRG